MHQLMRLILLSLIWRLLDLLYRLMLLFGIFVMSLGRY